MRVLMFKRGWLIVFTIIAAIIIMIGVIANPKFVDTAAVKREIPIYCVETDKKHISLSFDAAWGNEDTDQLIEILEKYNARATFFVVGDWVDRFPDSVLALHNAGHEIMNHSNSHKHMTELSSAEIMKDIEECNRKIEEITGEKPSLFRAPYGEYDDNVVKTVKDMGMYTIQWDVDTLDSK